MYVLDHEYFIVKGGGPSLQRMGVLRRPLVFEKKWGAKKEERMALGRLSRKKVHMRASQILSASSPLARRLLINHSTTGSRCMATVAGAAVSVCGVLLLPLKSEIGVDASFT